MKKLIIVLFICAGLSNITYSQVSGSLGNRMIAEIDVSPDIMGFLFDPNDFTMGVRGEFNYITHRNRSFGVLLDYDVLSGHYRSVPIYGLEDFDFSYTDYNKADGFPIYSTLMELHMKAYPDGQIAPLGTFTKLSVGMVIATHEFDEDTYKEDFLEPSYGYNASVDDIQMTVKDRYISPFIGLGWGESYPVYENLFINAGLDFRLFLVKNGIFREMLDEYVSGNTTEEMVAYEVLWRPILHKTLNISFGVSYAF
ncbi:MAG: hypothetical protein R6U19_06870 [Bacteroidales bacterium]